MEQVWDRTEEFVTAFRAEAKLYVFDYDDDGIAWSYGVIAVSQSEAESSFLMSMQMQEGSCAVRVYDLSPGTEITANGLELVVDN